MTYIKQPPTQEEIALQEKERLQEQITRIMLRIDQLKTLAKCSNVIIGCEDPEVEKIWLIDESAQFLFPSGTSIQEHFKQLFNTAIDYWQNKIVSLKNAAA